MAIIVLNWSKLQLKNGYDLKIMLAILERIPFLIELFLNGTFIVFYCLYYYFGVPIGFDVLLVQELLEVGCQLVPFSILLVMLSYFWQTKSIDLFFRKHAFSIVVFVPLLIAFGDQEFCFWLSSVHLLSSILSLYEGSSIQYKGGSGAFGVGGSDALLRFFKLRPAQIVLVTFLGLILFGAALLMLPFASVSGKSFPFIDALFMATSATCVTGLTTLDMATQFTLFGQLVILALIQVGGLGIMILYASMTIVIGRSMPMKERVVMQDLMDVSGLEELIDLIIDIIKYTFVIELWGAVILTIGFSLEGIEFGRALYFGIFHSISAFCNAGIALFSNNLESFSTVPWIHFTIAILIILGGLGFVVLREMRLVLVRKYTLRDISVYSKIVLVTTFLLIVTGTLFIFFGEFLNALDKYTLWEKFQISFFQSVTTRTAGYQTVQLSSFNQYTVYVMIILMFIGAGSGSTAGGIKVSTFAILVQSIRSVIKGKDRVEIFERTIPNLVVVKSTALTLISVIITALFIFIMMRIEPNQPFLSICFEAVSAIGTVGLSLGITAQLSALGKFCLVVLMYTGRVGPLTLLLAIGEKSNYEGKVDYPDCRVMIG